MSRLLIFCLTISSSLACADDGNENVNRLIADGASVQQLASGFGFSEGPAADADGNLFFTDVGKNRIHHWNVAAKKLTTVREKSRGANGLFVDHNDALWVCEIRGGRLARRNADGSYEVIVDDYQDAPLTGPNDLWIDPSGGIYFSDSYMGSQKRDRQHRVFYRSSQGTLSLVANNFWKSNGLLGTADGRWIYIADYINNKVYRYEILTPGKLGHRTVFAKYRCDGMTIDNQGNVYLCTGTAGHGIVVFDSNGHELGKIPLPEDPANVCFGGPKNQTLFVCAKHGLYSLEMKVSGSRLGSPQQAITIDEGGLADLVVEGAVPRRLASGFRIAQGPATDHQGNVFFSDIYHHRIMKWHFDSQTLEQVREHPGGPDGLYVESDGSLLVCELIGRQFGRLQPNGTYEVIADSFADKSLTGPNDVYVDRQGGIYFSDSYPGSKIRHPANHCVYYLAPGSSKLTQIIDDHFKTKGIHESADGEWLFVADYGGRKVYRYRLLAPGVLGKKEVFVDTLCGGLTLDERGNVYLSTVGDELGVLVYDPSGTKIGQIKFPDKTTNVTFAGPKRNQLVVTTFESLYSLQMKVKGLPDRITADH